MKRHIMWPRRLASLLLAGALAVPSLALGAGAQQGQPGLPYTVAPVNPAYLDYLKNGGDAIPPMVDLSHLAKNGAELRSRHAVPAAFDLREEGRVGPVHDQSQYSTCWTFSAMAAAESGLLARNPRADLSEWQLAYFGTAGEEEGEFIDSVLPGYEPFTRGGNNLIATASLAAWKGAVSEQAVPYDSGIPAESLRYASQYHLQNAFCLPASASDNDHSVPAQMMKELLMEYGALSISYRAADTQQYYNEQTCAQYSPEKALADHAVTAVGWDDHFSRENFSETARPENDGAWLVKNSWSADWGDHGYFWLSYEDKTLYDGAFFDLEPADNYARNYQYDITGWGASLAAAPGSTAGYAANVFTAQGNEQVEAVSFYTTDADARYEIEIYTGLRDPANPVSGKKAFTAQSGRQAYAGYHTVRLEQAAVLTKGEQYSVVVKLENPSYAYPLAAEGAISNREKSYEHLGDGGESYYSEDGKHWKDIYGSDALDNGRYIHITNLCVKAFTNPVQTISFSLEEGPVDFDQTLALTSPGADEIYYTTDGGDPATNGTLYTGPVAIDREMTVKAAAKTGGVWGPVREKEYTQAEAELTYLLLEQDGATRHLDLSAASRSFSIYVTGSTTAARVSPSGSAETITVNGKKVDSAKWSDEIPLAMGRETEITVRSQDQGRKTVEYTLRVYRSALTYDYRAETVSFDGAAFLLADPQGKELKSGDSVTPYILETGDSVLTLTGREPGAKAHSEYVPNRQVAGISPIDFVNERTEMMYGSWNLVGNAPDLSDGVIWEGDYIPLVPGVAVYIQKYATDTAFASNIVRIEVPERPAAPQSPGINFAAETTAAPVGQELVYSGSAQFEEARRGDGQPFALTPGQSVYLRYVPTSEAFASAICTLAVPERPAAPDPPTADSVAADAIGLRMVKGAEYRLNEGAWQASPLFTGLSPDTAYTASIRLASTGQSFASQASGSAMRTTAAQEQKPGSTDPSEQTSSSGAQPPQVEPPYTGDQDAPVLWGAGALSLLFAAAAISLKKRAR